MYRRRPAKFINSIYVREICFVIDLEGNETKQQQQQILGK